MPRGRASSKATSKSTKSSPNAAKSAVRKSSMRKSRPSAPVLPPAPSPLRPAKSSKRLDFDPNAIRSYRELTLALEAEKVQLTLADNIIVEDNILINHDVAINFNGFSMICEDSHPGARVLDIRSGEVSLIGHGKIFAMGQHSVAIRVFGAISSGVPNYTTLTIDEGISLFAPDAYGILISPNLGVAYGLTINFSGQIFARDGICLASGIHGHDPNFPVINLKSSARVTADETFGTALEASGYGEWNVSTAKLHGAIAANLSSGILHFQHAQAVSSQSTFLLAESATKDLEITVDGGNYISMHDSVISGTPASLKSFLLKGGAELCSPIEPILPELKPKLTLRKSLNFRSDVEDFIASLTPPAPAEPLESPTQPAATPISVNNPSPTAPISTGVAALPTPEPEVATSAPVPQPASQKPIPTELTDDATDEREIILELTAEKVARPTSPILSAPPKPAHPVTNEQDAARLALSDAISDIRRLSAEDYDVGFTELEQAIQKSEKILANPLASLANIRDAANDLLKAFDGLEEKDEFSLSDEELDDLFYHGAVLGELTNEIERVKHEKKIKHINKKSPQDPQALLRAAQAEVGFTPNTATPPSPQKSTSPKPTPPSAPVHAAPATNFDALTEALSTISGLNLSHYHPASQQSLLAHLASAQSILSDTASTQAAVDQITASLLSDMASLEQIQPTSHPHSAYQTKLSAPAPIIKSPIPPSMIDELAPNPTWSQGITMIDEMTPFVTSVSTRQRMLRALQPRLIALLNIITSPFRKLVKSLSAGMQAGIRAYRETLHSAQG